MRTIQFCRNVISVHIIEVSSVIISLKGLHNTPNIFFIHQSNLQYRGFISIIVNLVAFDIYCGCDKIFFVCSSLSSLYKFWRPNMYQSSLIENRSFLHWCWALCNFLISPIIFYEFNILWSLVFPWLTDRSFLSSTTVFSLKACINAGFTYSGFNMFNAVGGLDAIVHPRNFSDADKSAQFVNLTISIKQNL